jgi:hypothetical protein
MNDTLAGFEERRLAELKEHVARRATARRPRFRLVPTIAAGTAVAAATGAVVILSTGGGDPAYAVTKDADGVVYVKVYDFTDAEGLNEQLGDLGVPAVVDYVPAGQKCRNERGAAVDDVPRGLYYPPTQIPGEESGTGWQMRIDTKLFKPGQTFVWERRDDPVTGFTATSTILRHDPVAPCVLVPDDTAHSISTGAYPNARDHRKENKTVGELKRELGERGVKVTYLVTEPQPRERIRRFAPYVMYPTKQNTPVGDDWFVWQSYEPNEGEVRLMVTQRLL